MENVGDFMASKKNLSEKQNVSPVPVDQTFHQLFEQRTVIMLLIEPQTGMILESSAAAEIFYGVPQSKLCGMSIDEINAQSPGQMALKVQKAKDEGKNYIIIPQRLASGEARTVEIHSSPFVWQQKQTLFLIIHDITERAQISAALNHTNVVLQEEAVQREISLEDLQVYQIELEMQNEELRKAQANLEVAKARYFDLYDLAPVGYCTVSEQGLILEANLTAANLLGDTRAGLLAKPFSRFVGREHQDIYYLRRTNLFKTGTAQAFDGQMIKENGSGTFWGHLDISLAWDPNGVAVARVVISDISERKQAEAALRDSNEITQVILNSANEGIFLIEINGKVLAVNEAIAARVGKSVTDLIGTNNYDYLPVEMAAVSREHVAAVVREHKPVVFEFELFGRWHENRIYPVTDNDGQVRRVAVFGRDITERKQADDALRATEEHLREVLENSLDVAYKRNLKLDTYEYMSPVMAQISGYSPEELQAIPLEKLLNLTHPDDRAEIDRVLAEAASGVNGNACQVDYRFRHKNGQYRWFHDQFKVLHDTQGQPLSRIGSVSDITDRKQADEKIRSLNVELEKLVVTDTLTQINNRRYFMQRAVEEVNRESRNNQPLVLLMMDLDHFKKINDSYGHAVGDVVLQQVAAVLKSNLREIDILGRIGGEEFAMLLPNTFLEEAVLLAERLRQSVEKIVFETPGNLPVTVTFSIGAAVFEDAMTNIGDLLRNADEAMYYAKHSGRNCVKVYQGVPPPPEGVLRHRRWTGRKNHR